MGSGLYFYNIITWIANMCIFVLLYIPSIVLNLIGAWNFGYDMIYDMVCTLKYPLMQGFELLDGDYLLGTESEGAK